MNQNVQVGNLQVSYSKSGVPTYRLELWHRELKKHRVIRGNERRVVERKATLQAGEWNEKWDSLQRREAQKRGQQEKKESAAERTAEAAAALATLDQLLAHTLDIDDAIDWEGLKDHSEFPEPPPAPAPKPVPPPKQPQLSFLDKLIRSRRERKMAETQQRLEKYQADLARIGSEHFEAVKRWEARKTEFLEEQREANEAVDRGKARYESKDPDAIVEYCDMVLSRSQYPDCMPQEWDLDYSPETKTLIVDYALPSLDALPTLSEVRYVQSRDEFTEKHISEPQKKRLYDSVIYQITLRTIHELYEADVVGAFDAVVFNGRVTSIDRATGHEATACILSVHAKRDEFLSVNLANVDPKACFKSLKGVGSSKLHSLTPVAPIIEMRREDGRFVAAREVADTIDDSVNLAAMDWEDFEHLIREIFEQEFASGGGEVKVTQASRDGGVDAIAFDPDPIRGGKIVIQAKRYTNTVGVAAVRDLYGTVMNEGANRGILVTTSDFGPDAYSFAKDKPLSLLNGANLLHLLEKHGRRAKIDIAEARRLLS